MWVFLLYKETFVINLPKNYRASFSGPCLADLERSDRLQQLLQRTVPRDKSYAQKLVDGHVTTPNTLRGAPAAYAIQNSVTARMRAAGAAMPMQRAS